MDAATQKHIVAWLKSTADAIEAEQPNASGRDLVERGYQIWPQNRATDVRLLRMAATRLEGMKAPRETGLSGDMTPAQMRDAAEFYRRAGWHFVTELPFENHNLYKIFSTKAEALDDAAEVIEKAQKQASSSFILDFMFDRQAKAA